MNPTRRLLYSVLAAATMCIVAAQAQQPTPMIVVQPANAVPATTPAPQTQASSDTAIANAIKSLEEVKAANEATLKKQEAMLQQLDELQKAAEQLKVFS